MGIIFPGLGAALALLYQLQIATGRPAVGSWGRSLAKTGATVALVAWSFGLAAPWLIVAGLALGAVGDFCLSRGGRPMFLAGMAAFAAGHLAYAVAFWIRADVAASPPPAHLAAAAASALCILALGRWLSAQAGALRLPVLGYAVVIGLMAASALILPASEGTGILRVGVVLFLLSDTLLALRLFVASPASHAPLDLAVWPTYWLGQTLILLGALGL